MTITYTIPGVPLLNQPSGIRVVRGNSILEAPSRVGLMNQPEKGAPTLPWRFPRCRSSVVGARGVTRRKWPGETQAERTRAYQRDLSRRKQEAKLADPNYVRNWGGRPKGNRIPDTPRRRRNLNLRFRFKLSEDQYAAMWNAQQGKCAICGETFGLWSKPSVDHCHITNEIRGIVCGLCNRMIGMANDDIGRLSAAINHLEALPPDIPEQGIYNRPTKKPTHELKKSLREIQLRNRYGITLYGYDYLLSLQHGCCRICRRPFGNQHAHVDHDHTSQKVRGLLCRICNVILGMARENPSNLRAGIAYLEATCEHHLHDTGRSSS